MNQALALVALIKKDRRVNVPKPYRYLYVSILDKAIDALVLWEFGASRDPYSVLLTTNKQKDEIVRYIEKYVIIRGLEGA